jgi:hypothetical protein
MPKRMPQDEPTFRKGDAVAWNASQGETHGTVERTLTAPTDIEGHHVAASPESPEYLVRSDKTGAEAAHKPSALRPRRKG